MVNVNGKIIYCNVTVMLYGDCSNISNHKVTRQLQMVNINVKNHYCILTVMLLLTFHL